MKDNNIKVILAQVDASLTAPLTILCRSLHDLSCQFGTKGFTKQMRQIAGGSKAGLRKFLQQYPSLFVIQNDTVQVANVPPRSRTVRWVARDGKGRYKCDLTS